MWFFQLIKIRTISNINKLFDSFATCSLSSLAISQIFAKHIHLLNLSVEKSQLAAKAFKCVLLISSVVCSLVYPNASVTFFIAVCVASIAISCHFRKSETILAPKKEEAIIICPPKELLEFIISKVGEKEDPVTRFKTLSNVAQSNKMLRPIAQKERAKIINNHPEIPTLSFFNDSFEEMIKFAKAYRVHKLNLSSSNITKDDIITLKTDLPYLTHLNISGCDQVDSAGIKTLAAFIHLEHLDMHNCRGVEYSSLKTIIPQLTNLTHLNISSCEHVGPAGLRSLLSLKDTLVHLDLQDCRGLSNKSLLKIISKLTNLKHLNISGLNAIHRAGIQSIVSLKNLEHLDMNGCHGVDDLSLHPIATQLTKLTYLNISSCEFVTTVGIQHLANLTNLFHLDMHFCRGVDDLSLQTIAPKLTNLAYLDISNCYNISVGGIQTLVFLVNLVHLDMNHCNGVNDLSLQTISPHLKKLEYLNLNYCKKILTTGFEAIAVLKNLIHLELEKCKIEDLSFQKIIPHLTKLEYLNLNYCENILTTGFEAITDLKNLIHLELVKCKIEDLSLQKIIPQLTKLSYLNLNWCLNLGPHGIESLSSFKNIVELKT